MENEETTVDIQDETQEDEVIIDDSDITNEPEEDEAAKLKSENAKLRRLLNKKDKEKEVPKETQGDFVTKDEIQRFRLEAKGYSDKQIDMLMKMGGAEALKSEDIKIAIDAIGEREKQQKAQAESTIQSKSDRNYTDEQLRSKSSDEILKLYREGKIK